jgi:hypothetical protein
VTGLGAVLGFAAGGSASVGLGALAGLGGWIGGVEAAGLGTGASLGGWIGGVEAAGLGTAASSGGWIGGDEAAGLGTGASSGVWIGGDEAAGLGTGAALGGCRGGDEPSGPGPIPMKGHLSKSTGGTESPGWSIPDGCIIPGSAAIPSSSTVIGGIRVFSSKEDATMIFPLLSSRVTFGRMSVEFEAAQRSTKSGRLEGGRDGSFGYALRRGASKQRPSFTCTEVLIKL